MKGKFLRIWMMGLLLIQGLGLQLAWADTARLTELFERSFYTSLYEKNRCGQNILRFIERAVQQDIDVSPGHILQISNAGTHNFGLVRAFVAREAGPLFGETTPEAASGKARFHPGERNWEMHVVFEYEGHIYDFDYSNSPRVLPKAEYFRAMFLPDNPPERFLKAIPDYAVNVTSVGAYLRHARREWVSDREAAGNDYPLSAYLRKEE